MTDRFILNRVALVQKVPGNTYGEIFPGKQKNMNFLAHLFLAEPTDESRIGGILADFTVGRIEELRKRYGPGIARGIQRHRDIDRFTDSF